jgi:HEAT repeat protein
VGKNRRIIITTLSALVLAWIIWQYQPPADPTYEGKHLSEYLDQIAQASPFFYNEDTFKPIRQMGPETIPYLRWTLRRKDSVYVKTLIYLRPHLPSALVRHLPDTDPYRLRHAAEASAYCLGALGSDAKEALPDLIATLPDLHGSAWSAISQIAPQPENLPTLLTVLNSKDTAAAYWAADSIAQLGITNAAVLRSLTNLVNGNNPEFDRKAIITLSRLGDKAAPTIPFLTKLLDSTNSTIRITAAVALQQINGRRVVPATWMIHELDRELHQEATPSSEEEAVKSIAFDLRRAKCTDLCNLLITQKTDAKPAVPLLRILKDDPDPILRLVATKALYQINHETNGLVSVCSKSFQSESHIARYHGAELLAAICMDQQLLLPELKQLLDHHDIRIQFLAALTYSKLDAPSDKILPIMMRALESHFISGEWQSELQCHAAEALGEMGSKAKPAIPALLVALKDPNEKVRTAAAKALKQIAPEAATKTTTKTAIK